jgi:hypothetical protein
MVKSGRKYGSVSVLMFLCVTLSTIVILPNTSSAFSSATAKFFGNGFESYDEISLISFTQNITSEIDPSEPGWESIPPEFSGACIKAHINETMPILLQCAAKVELFTEIQINFDSKRSINRTIRLVNVGISYVAWNERSGEDSTVTLGISFGKIYWTCGGITTGWDVENGNPITIEAN